MNVFIHIASGALIGWLAGMALHYRRERDYYRNRCRD